MGRHTHGNGKRGIDAHGRGVRDCVEVSGSQLPSITTKDTKAQRRFCVLVSFVVLQFLEQTRTVSLLILLNTVHVQDTQQEISGRHRLSVVMDMAAAFELAAESADEEMRHIVMLMLIRVA